MNNNLGFDDCKIEFTNDINNLLDGGYLIEVNANSMLGFNYPYLLFIPKNVNSNSTIIVEGANTRIGTELTDLNDTDNILKAVDDVRRNFNNHHPIKSINEKTTNYPFLYPLFPRPIYKNKSFYNHMLSSNSMFTNEEVTLKTLGIYRTDLQLIAMIKDASNKLKENGLNIHDKVIMYGFSASAKFVNRFTLLHPEMVEMVFAAALGGTITLPLKELDGEKLLWPVGIGNVDEITTDKIELYKKVPQYYSQGILDTNDCYQPNGYGTCKYEGILQDDEAKQMYRLLGKTMNGDRWQRTIQLISNLNSMITLKSSLDTHQPKMISEVIEEVLTSFSKNKNK